jgi:bis(5'-nucleosyl)-tetraphosphatase (symmetrical)
MNYLIGDVQGCCNALDRLLAEIGFSPSRDHLHVLGDVVNRGPASLATVQRLVPPACWATTTCTCWR